MHCAGGYRASVAASFLSAANRRLVAIDDTFDNAKLTGLHLITADDHTAADDDGSESTATLGRSPRTEPNPRTPPARPGTRS